MITVEFIWCIDLCIHGLPLFTCIGKAYPVVLLFLLLQGTVRTLYCSFYINDIVLILTSGLTFLEKWNTDNVLGTEITIEDQMVKGLKVAFDTSFAPQTGKKSGKIKTSYKQDYVNTNCDVDFDFAGPTINGSLVLGWVIPSLLDCYLCFQDRLSVWSSSIDKPSFVLSSHACMSSAD